MPSRRLPVTVEATLTSLTCKDRTVYVNDLLLAYDYDHGSMQTAILRRIWPRSHYCLVTYLHDGCTAELPYVGSDVQFLDHISPSNVSTTPSSHCFHVQHLRDRADYNFRQIPSFVFPQQPNLEHNPVLNDLSMSVDSSLLNLPCDSSPNDAVWPDGPESWNEPNSSPLPPRLLPSKYSSTSRPYRFHNQQLRDQADYENPRLLIAVPTLIDNSLLYLSSESVENHDVWPEASASWDEPISSPLPPRNFLPTYMSSFRFYRFHNQHLRDRVDYENTLPMINSPCSIDNSLLCLEFEHDNNEVWPKSTELWDEPILFLPPRQRCSRPSHYSLRTMSSLCSPNDTDHPLSPVTSPLNHKTLFESQFLSSISKLISNPDSKKEVLNNSFSAWKSSPFKPQHLPLVHFVHLPIAVLLLILFSFTSRTMYSDEYITSSLTPLLLPVTVHTVSSNLAFDTPNSLCLLLVAEIFVVTENAEWFRTLAVP